MIEKYDQPETADSDLVTDLPDITGIQVPATIQRNFWKSISFLITGLLDAPTAWLEGKARNIRTEAAAKDIVANAAAKAASERFSTDTALGDRAVTYFAHRVINEQINREAVAKVTINTLAKDPPKNDCIDEIDEDWLNGGCKKNCVTGYL